ncbi:PREDICTED: uncharacterized protein LOC109476214 [Branchiostoma belcheri]|uniref:Uncharacterized protein LOC109476214 n=1 Tax=Branchiostoma belcheri TaxID=7741 RepID=A0A6P4ZSR8_BRABE|nr:PREDICTED: uncharacterized protein LOC109476214 [Branchiostoma belcheri]
MTYVVNGYSLTTEITNSSTTSISLTGLSPGVLYNISLVAVSADDSVVSAEATGGPLTVRTNPNAPEDFAVTTITTTTIGLNWTEPDSANNATFAKYRMTYVDNGYSLTTEITNSSTTSISLTGLSPGVLYSISLVAVSADDSVVSAEAAGGPLTVRTNPNAPEDFAVTTITTTTIGLNWTEPDSANNATFAKYRMTYDANVYSLTTLITNPSTTSISLTGLSPGVLYSLSLVAVSAEPSLTVSAEAAGGPLTVRTRPNPPQRFFGEAQNSTTISLSWSAPASTNGAEFAKYWITYTPSGGVSQTEEIVNPAVTSFSLTGLSPGVLYTISVVAVSAEPSLTVSAEAAGGPLTVRTVPNAPQSFTGETQGTTTIGLSWSPPDTANNATFAKYRITYTPSGGASQTTEISDPTATSTSLTGLFPGVLYSISLVAVSADDSVVSAEAAGGPLTFMTTCPGSYSYLAYTNRCYRAYDSPKTYDEALVVCLADGGTLAMPRDSTTNDFLIALKNNVSTTRLFRFGLHLVTTTQPTTKTVKTTQPTTTTVTTTEQTTTTVTTTEPTTTVTTTEPTTTTVTTTEPTTTTVTTAEPTTTTVTTTEPTTTVTTTEPTTTTVTTAEPTTTTVTTAEPTTTTVTTTEPTTTTVTTTEPTTTIVPIRTTQLLMTATADATRVTATKVVADCGCPLLPSHAEVSLTATTSGSVATYRCKTGFQSANGTTTLTCGSDGEWKGVLPTCEAMTPCIRFCGFGSCFVDGGIQKCDCNTGYGFFGLSQFCLDTNECEDGLDYCLGRPACVPNARCINSPYGSYTCRCPSGYIGDGKTSCEDEDECLSAPCSEFANCTNTAGSYTCQCLDGYVGSGTVCTEINECSSSPCIGGTCVDRINGYTCTCREGFAGERCETNVNDCEPPPCLNNGTCSDRINTYSCDCVDGWEGINCEDDMNECTSDPCHRHADCGNTNGSFICTCKQGFHGDGFECTETDECASDPCQNDATCIDGLNKYSCDCPSEWQGVNCESDVDECLREKCHQNSACNNSPGSYSCTCREGFYGNGLTQEKLVCRETILFPYGEKQGDVLLPDTDDRKDISLPSLIDISVGFPFFGDFYYSLYFSDNGLIIFPPTAQSRARREPYPNPSLFRRNQTVQAGFPPMVAASWGDVDLTTDVGKVWYQVYTDDNSGDNSTQTVFDMVTTRMYQSFSDTFVPTWVLVVTWDSVPSVEAMYTKQDPNTFQAVLATDGSDSVAFLTYKEDEMLWTNETQDVLLGYNSANGVNFENIRLADPYRPDQVNGNTGLKGRWAFKLESEATRKTNYKKLCRDWYKTEPIPSEWIVGEGLCPCTLLQALRDLRFTPVKLSPLDINLLFQVDQDLEVCFSPLFASPTGSSVDCCYKFLALNTEIPLAGSHHRYQRFSQLHTDFDVNPKSWCCSLSDDEDFCNLYYEKRPPNSCSFYRPPRLAITWGDPHMKTLDGLAYTFNGLGEFTLVKTSGASVEFRLQGRTEKAVGTQGAAEATVFTAFAFKQDGSSTVEMGMNENRANMTLMVDGNSINITDLRQNGAQRFVNVTLQYNFNSNQTSVVASFSSGITVTVTLQKLMLNVQFGAPDSFENTTRGMLGVWNDNILDDFTYPNGTVLQAPEDRNLTEEEIFPWGLSWQIREDESLFTYEDGQNATSFAKPNFRPKFLGQLLAAVSAEKESEAEVLCGTNVECLFDFLSTNDTEVGEQTRSSIVTFDSDAETLVNGILQWTPRSLRPVQLEIIAQDNKGASSSTYPMVKLCNCQHGGICNFVTRDFTGDINPVGGFQVVSCSCPEAWTGEFCETDKNECEEDPCYPGAACTDMVAPEHGFECGPCPNGLHGTGEKCYDIDECVEGTAGCAVEATCTNTEGSFICTCTTGYTGNGSYCADVDECTTSSSCDRHAVCDNTVGSYTCTCKAGYEGSGRRCEDQDECVDPDICHTNARCTNSIGSYSCSCNSGYRREGAVCTNVDECEELLDNCSPGQGICTDNPGSYSCACRGGYAGDGITCKDLDECSDDALNNCTENADCANTEGSYNCLCTEGYKGIGTENCTDVDECKIGINNCAQDATCINIPGSFTCSCNEGFVGNGIQCEDIDECARGEADCDIDTKAVCTNLIGGYNCTCYNGYEGDGRHCTDLNECMADNGKCSMNCTNTEGSYTCSCEDGYRLAVDGFKCDDIDECAEQLDDCEQACTNTDGGFSCSCVPGFIQVGDSCEASENCTRTVCTNADCFVENGIESCLCFSGYNITIDATVCTDTDECSSNTLNTCDQLCNNTNGGYTCGCDSGYMIGTDGRQCTDIDECSDSSLNDCDPNAFCNNNQGGYTCSCRQGYTGNGTSCEDYDECTFGSRMENCSANSQCFNFNGGFNCTCRDGYTGDGFFCADVDECTGDSSHCHEQAVCTNVLGSFECTCKDGYKGTRAACEDIDECENGVSQCDGNATCTNNVGSYTCTCDAGYTGTGKTCTDVDECLSGQDDCHEQASCRNTEGSYVCSCNTGFTGSGTNCEDEHECTQGTDTCTENSVCTNTIGSFTCPCKPGYFGSDCVDVHECEDGIDNCHDHADCTNTPGSYSCTCHSGYFGDGTVCTDINECENGMSHCDGNATCTNTVGSYTCTCDAGYTGTGKTCTDFDECATNPDICDDNANCTNTPGSYSCTCYSGYSGNGTFCTVIAVTKGSTPTTPTSMTVTSEPPKPRKFVPAQITMEKTFRAEYNDKTSAEYMELSSQLKTSLAVIYTGIPGFVEIIIIQFVAGSVKARYAAVFVVEDSQPDSIIQDMAKTNLQQAITSGRFAPTLQVTSSDSLQPTVLTEEELEQVVGGFCQDVQCGEVGVCSRTEPYPGAVIAECLCQENYCNTGTCEYNVQEGPKCTCPAVQGTWYGGERCQIRLTQADVIGIAAGCLCALLVVALLVAVCMAKIRSRRSAKKEMRYRVSTPPVTLPYYHTASQAQQPFRDLPVTDLSEDQDDYLSPVHVDADMLPPTYTDSLRSGGRRFFNPTVENIPTGEVGLSWAILGTTI